MPTEGITHHYYNCACSSSDHTLRISLHEEYKGDEPSLYTEVQLQQYRPWYARIWPAIKYVFGYECRYGHWDCFLFEKETAVQLRDLLNRYIKMLEDFKPEQTAIEDYVQPCVLSTAGTEITELPPSKRSSTPFL